MDTIDYQFVFDKTQERQSSVILQSPKVAPICLSVGIDHSPFHCLTHSDLPPAIVDILDLAAAIHVADKLSLPKKTRSVRTHIDLPLHNPEIFAQFNQQLSELMLWYTSDHWSFKFSRHEKQPSRSFPPVAEYAKFSPIPELTEVALWSGGLDSLAGLCLRLMGDQNKQFVLIGTGSNGIMHGRQKQVFHSLHTMPIASGRLSFLQLPIDLDYKKERYRTNKSHRARGIVFLLIGAASALLIENHRLGVYETGIGAINLPLPGGIGRDHSKAVHPISLAMVGNLISNLLGRSFSIENPFIFKTKGEMCLPLKDNPLLIFETISCDCLHREKYIQCGYCSSCILRRQALMVADIEEKTRYFIPHARRAESRHQVYWYKMNQQVVTIEQALRSDDSWRAICQEYTDMPDIVGCMAEKGENDEYSIKDNLIGLYQTYVHEWRNVAPSLLEEITANRVASNHSLEDKQWQQMRLIN